jgi:hypothetical protein
MENCREGCIIPIGKLLESGTEPILIVLDFCELSRALYARIRLELKVPGDRKYWSHTLEQI